MENFNDYLKRIDESLWQAMTDSEYRNLPPQYKLYHDSLNPEQRKLLNDIKTGQQLSLMDALQELQKQTPALRQQQSMWKKVPPERKPLGLKKAPFTFGTTQAPGDWKRPTP